jgi:multidrug efflux pump subunit AcrB
MKKITSLLKFSSILVVSSFFLAGCQLSPENKLQDQTQQKQDSTSTQNQQQNNEQAQNQFSGSIKDLMSSTRSQECTWADEEGNHSTLYTDGKRVRVETQVNIDDSESVQNNVSIADGEYVYSWDKQTKKGMKISQTNQWDKAEAEGEDEEVEFDEVEPTEEDNYQQMMNQNYEFSCQKWKVDESHFQVPNDVELTDMNQMMEDLQMQTQQMQQKMEGLGN